LSLCECGCGKPVSKPGNRFVNGHWRRGKPLTKEHRRKIREAKRGHKHSEETRRKLSEAQRGRKHSEEIKRKMSKAQMGNKNCLGHEHSEETKRRISEATSCHNHYNWQGGKSLEPYGLSFNGILKRAIRKRDGYTCQLCYVIENGQAHDCHHIDYDKQNNAPGNLIALCRNCHSMTGKDRGYWEALLAMRVNPGGC